MVHSLPSVHDDWTSSWTSNKSFVASQSPVTHLGESDICAKLVTINKSGDKESIVLCLDKPVTIGRDPVASTYVVPDVYVSGVHCKLYAVRSSTGGIIVSCHDFSTNGISLNGNKISKASVILMDGDHLDLPNSQSFECIHVWKEPRQKVNLFDPTPPQRLYRKTSDTIKIKQIGKYKVTSHCLGSGSFATVHLAIDEKARKQVACKVITTKKEGDLDSVMKEVAILKPLSHPNINKVVDVETTKNGKTAKFLNIFLELSTGGDLFTYITSQRDSRLIEGESKYIMYQLLRGLMYLHKLHISHRDLKPENILLYTPGPYPRVQIADFGLARPMAYQETLNVCGTVSYLPPEGILALDYKHLGYTGMPADCWSAGITLYIMLAGHNPFDTSGIYDEEDSYAGSVADDLDNSQCSVHAEIRIKRRIVRGKMGFADHLWAAYPEARKLVARLLVHDPQYRATAFTAFDSEWIAMDKVELETAYRARIGPEV